MSGLPPLPTHLRICPSRLAIDRTLRLDPGDCATIDARVSFATLLRSMGSLEGSRYASPLVGRIIVRSLMKKAAGWLADSAADAYAVRAVHRGLLELRMAGVTAEHFEAMETSAELSKLVRLLASYESRLRECGLADEADRERQGVYAVTQGRLPALWSRVQRVTVEGGASLFGARLDLLDAFVSRGIEVGVRLPYDTERAEAFAWPEASLHGLESRAQSKVTPQFDARHGDGPLRAMRQAQFTDAVAAGAPVRVLHAPSPAEHARGIATEVRRWLRAGVPADEIAVGVGDLHGLGRMIAAELESVDVPVAMRRGPSLRATDAGRALEQALHMPEQGFPREHLLELWRTLGRRLDSEVGELAPDRLAAEVRRAGSRSARLLAFRDALEARAARDAGRGEAPAIRARAIADALDEVMATMNRSPESARLDEHVEALETMFAELKLSLPRLLAWPDDPDGVGVGRRRLLRGQAWRDGGADGVRDLLVELRQAALTAPHQVPWTRAEVGGLVTLLLGERALAPAGVRCGSVTVVGVDELVETRFRRVILAGIDADVFPRSPPIDLVLTGDVRAEVNRLLGSRLLQYGATTGRDALRGDARDTWHWLEALACCDEELVVTFGTADGDEAGTRSELVDELLRSLGGQAVEAMRPSYAAGTGASLHHVVQGWSLGSLGAGGRLAASMSPGVVSALDALLRQNVVGSTEGADRIESIARRVLNERDIRGEARRAAPLGEAECSWMRHHFFETVQSTSRLDTLGKCAFLHFARHILRLEPDEIPDLGADAREEGSAAHAALQFIYEDLKQRGGLAKARHDPERSRTRAREVFDEHAERILEEVTVHPVLRPAVLEEAWSTAVAQLDRDLESDEPLEPTALEWGFDDRDGGDAEALELHEPDGGRSIRVRGKIDRIDQGDGAVVAIDYKRTRQDRVPGRHFQLPIYGLVGLRDFAPEATQIRAVWIALRDGKTLMPEDLETDPVAFERHLHDCLWPRIDRVTGGDISPDPDAAKSCRHCDFKRLCRYDVLRDTAREDGE